MNIIAQQSERGSQYFANQCCLSNMCGLHMLNNFFGYSKYTEKDMNKICSDLSPKCINPHKGIFGGNYDINVLMKAFKLNSIQLQYHDQRKDIQISGDQLGFVINYEASKNCCYKLLGLGRHWFVIKKVKNTYIEYDSLKKMPISYSESQIIIKLKHLNEDQSTILKLYSHEFTNQQTTLT